jgi:transposase
LSGVVGPVATGPTADGRDRSSPRCWAPWGSRVRSSFGSCPEQMKGSESRMQGKETSEQATSVKSNAGIDVSKAWLDVHVLPGGQTRRVANSKEGIRQLKRWLSRFDLALAVLEATGKWHRPAHRSLHASGLPVAMVDPYRVRMFAKAQGILAKTDRLDARLLAQFAAIMDPVRRPPQPEAVETLAELVKARDSAVAEQTALENQRAAATSKFLTRHLTRRIARADKDIAAIEREIHRQVQADPALARRYTILTSIPGCGFVTAITLIARMTELGTCTVRQAAMLAGLAPIPDDSGERQGVRVIWGGRPALRRALYLAALSARRFNADMKTVYDRLLAKGKEPKPALIAVARKLVILANTLIAQDRTWQKKAPKHA